MNVSPESEGLQAVPTFPEFQDSIPTSTSVSGVYVPALPAAPAGVSAEVWTAMGMMFDVKYLPLQQNLVHLNTAMVELQQFAVHKNDLAQTNSDVRQVGANVTELSQFAVCHSDRIGNLETTLNELREKFEKLELKCKRGPDDAFKRIVFLGLPNVSYEKRVEHMNSFMRAKFAGVHCNCSVYFRKGDSNKDRVMTNTGFAEFVSSDVRDFVLKQMEKNTNDFKLVIEGKEVAVRRARTRRASERNTALRNAAETLKKLAEMEGDVEIEWGREGQQRGVKVKGSYAFLQPSEGLGSVSGDFVHLDL